MKFLVLALFVAVATAFPDELARQRRSAVLGLAAPGAVVAGPSAVLQGPSGIVTSHGGVVSTAGLVAAAPAVRLAGATTLIPANALNAGSVIAPGATLIGPSTAGHPGVVASPLLASPVWGHSLLGNGAVILG